MTHNDELADCQVWQQLPGSPEERETVRLQILRAHNGNASKKDWGEIFDYVSRFDDLDYDELAPYWGSDTGDE